ncbi:MAG: hypothetical protein K5870_07735 [Lachnospiraceae bacterium]|nr:hypothetical protein [Lachnospiraceae bacterium]
MAIGNDFLNNRVNLDIERDNNFPKADNGQKPSAAERLDEQNKQAVEKKEADREKEMKEAVYGDVIGVSENGDIATAREESVKALEDGMVFKLDNDTNAVKNEENAENVRNEGLEDVSLTQDEQDKQAAQLNPAEDQNKAVRDNDADKKEDKEIESLTGYTKDQLQTLYTQGKIDKIKYDQEIERRKELMQEDDEKAVQQTEEEQKDTDAVKDAEQNRGNEEDEKKEETSRIQDEIERNEQAAETLGRVYANEADEQLRAQAVQEALASGRMDIVADIFNGNQNG